MPIINVRVVEGVFTPAQKKEIANKMTDAIVQIEGEAFRPLTLVVIDEVKSGDWVVGGQQITTQAAKAIAAGRSAA
jgi:4-oxalocrotonate tautomerase